MARQQERRARGSTFGWVKLLTPTPRQGYGAPFEVYWHGPESLADFWGVSLELNPCPALASPALRVLARGPALRRIGKAFARHCEQARDICASGIDLPPGLGRRAWRTWLREHMAVAGGAAGLHYAVAAEAADRYGAGEPDSLGDLGTLPSVVLEPENWDATDTAHWLRVVTALDALDGDGEAQRPLRALLRWVKDSGPLAS